MIYVTHNGVGSALVRSQVLPYLRGLIARGFDVRLLTFERDAPRFPDGEFPRERWHSRRARRGGGLVAKAIDLVVGVATIVGLVPHHRARLVHARSYVPAAMAVVAGLLTRTPFVFDMRGFLGEEYVEGGHWRPDDLRYRILKVAERVLLRRAAEIVVLTAVAARRLAAEPRYAPLVRGRVVSVMPCAVDLDRFRPAVDRAAVPTLVYSGSLGMWYALDEMLAVYAHARRALPRLRFLILNPDAHELVEAACRRLGLADADLVVRGVDFGAMPAELAAAHVGICLLRQATSKSGSSPIKVAEYLACGLPVVVNEGQGDTGDLVRRYDAGHVLVAYDDPGIEAAAAAVVRLAADRGARERARRLAEAEYDVAAGVAIYAEIWRRAGAVRPGGDAE